MELYAVSGLQAGVADVPESATPAVNPAQKDSIDHEIMLADQALDSFDAEKAGIEALQMVAAQQKQVVMAMVGGANPEIAIALALASSIDAYAVQLDILQKWTNGGKDAFEAALMQMFTEMKAEGISGIGYENMFQLVLLDVLVNAEEYGLDNDAFLSQVGMLLEKTGSGSHSDWNMPPEKLGEMCNSVWGTIYTQIQSGKIPTDSITYQAMTYMSGGSISSTPPKALSDRFTREIYMDPKQGGWIPSDGSLGELNPMTRMVILSAVNAEESLSAEEVEIILTGSKSEVDALLKSVVGMDALSYLFALPGWQDAYIPNTPKPPGVGSTIDFSGVIEPSYLKQLYSEFSPRQLTDEDIQEVNRIGDQVKMLQETLKYWIQICRDERMAVARNI